MRKRNKSSSKNILRKLNNASLKTQDTQLITKPSVDELSINSPIEHAKYTWDIFTTCADFYFRVEKNCFQDALSLFKEYTYPSHDSHNLNTFACQFLVGGTATLGLALLPLALGSYTLGGLYGSFGLLSSSAYHLYRQLQDNQALPVLSQTKALKS